MGGELSGGDRAEYSWPSASSPHNHQYLAPAVLEVLGPARGRRLVDMGCGNGALTAHLAQAGFVCVGLESSESGVAQARREHPDIEFHQHDLRGSLPAELSGQFDLVLSAEVIEHLFLPRDLFRRATEALSPDGDLVLSTPFHGYWKNLALAATNKFDHHWSPWLDYGHIKFFSIKTLSSLAEESGFSPVQVRRVGRVPPLAKTMIFHARLKV